VYFNSESIKVHRQEYRGFDSKYIDPYNNHWTLKSLTEISMSKRREVLTYLSNHTAAEFTPKDAPAEGTWNQISITYTNLRRAV
jgi:2'-5' RNA ligase